MKAVTIISTAALTGCAVPSENARLGSSGTEVPNGYDNVLRLGRGGDANIYDFAFAELGENKFALNITPTSGPNAEISNGSMKAERQKAISAADWFAAFQLCQNEAGINLSKGDYSVVSNGWSFDVKCGVGDAT